MSDLVANDTTVRPIGLVDGSVPATSRRFKVVLTADALVQLDDLVAVSRRLPDENQVTHYGIVVEACGKIEGAEYSSDTERIAGTQTMPGETARTVEVQVLRTIPEMWLAPDPGEPVRKASGVHRSNALFLDQMEKPLAVGYDQAGESVYADFAFIDGAKGGHISISGVSGVATKTSYALFFLYQLFETDRGRELFGRDGPNTKAIVFNVKGEDLLHLDRRNTKFAGNAEARTNWAKLGVPDPGPFKSVRIYAPRAARARTGSAATDVVSRAADDVRVFGWTPQEFIKQGLLRFCFADAEDYRNQISFVEQRVRIQLARHAFPLLGAEGAVVLCEPPEGTSFNLDRIAEERREPRSEGDGVPIRNFGDLVDFLNVRLSPETPNPAWQGNMAPATLLAFLRRLGAQQPRLGHLVSLNVEAVRMEESVTVIDIHSLHDDAQRFVVGALLSEVFEEKQGCGREPLRLIVLDELNKYAPREARSPIKEVLIDIASRGRSLGVILIGAQQSARDVDPAITLNAAVKVVGRLDAGEAESYKFLSNELRERAARFLPGTMILDQPLVPAPIPIRFPFPAFATCVAEGQAAADPRKVDELFSRI